MRIRKMYSRSKTNAHKHILSMGNISWSMHALHVLSCQAMMSIWMENSASSVYCNVNYYSKKPSLPTSPCANCMPLTFQIKNSLCLFIWEGMQTAQLLGVQKCVSKFSSKLCICPSVQNKILQLPIWKFFRNVHYLLIIINCHTDLCFGGMYVIKWM